MVVKVVKAVKKVVAVVVEEMEKVTAGAAAPFLTAPSVGQAQQQARLTLQKRRQPLLKKNPKPGR